MSAVSTPRAEALARLQVQEKNPQHTVVLAGAHVITMANAGPESDVDVMLIGDRIAAIGPGLAAQVNSDAVVVDVSGCVVLPGFVDSHAHLVFAGERSAEFAARMAGLPGWKAPYDLLPGQRLRCYV